MASGKVRDEHHSKTADDCIEGIVFEVNQQLALPGGWATIKEKRAEIGNHA
ncbi:MAG TPA: hypothetical protein VKR06_06275 [Ktedonosporobacter sp.]|nr:hypothetical protein [Ktedonosporobacter sp.]